jgi:hypothetical protein
MDTEATEATGNVALHRLFRKPRAIHERTFQKAVDVPPPPAEDLANSYAGSLIRFGSLGCLSGGLFGIGGAVGSWEGGTGSVKGTTICRRIGIPISNVFSCHYSSLIYRRHQTAAASIIYNPLNQLAKFTKFLTQAEGFDLRG